MLLNYINSKPIFVSTTYIHTDTTHNPESSKLVSQIKIATKKYIIYLKIKIKREIFKRNSNYRSREIRVF